MVLLSMSSFSPVEKVPAREVMGPSSVGYPLFLVPCYLLNLSQSEEDFPCEVRGEVNRSLVVLYYSIILKFW